jgi:prolyl oligopeptidase
MKNRCLSISLLWSLSVLAGCAHQPWSYPKAERLPLVEDYHGTKVPAPYRWLEADDSPETLAWTKAQNALTHSFLDSTGLTQGLAERLTTLWNFPKYSAPARKGSAYFFSKNDGLQNQSVLYVQDSLADEPRVLLDPNTLSADGTTALSGGAISPDGKLLAYGLSVHGSDGQEFHIRKVSVGADYPEVIKWCKFSGIAWTRDSDGFYYNRFPEPGSVPDADLNNFNRVYFHKLGTGQESDPLVFERPDAKELGFHPSTSDDGRYLVLTVYHGTDPRNGLYVMPLDDRGQPAAERFQRIAEPGQAMYNFIESDGNILFVHTDRNAPRGRIVAIDTEAPVEKYWREILAQHDSRVISSALLTGGRLVVNTMTDAANTLFTYALDGSDERRVEVPGIGSISDLSGDARRSELFLSFISFLQPPTIYRYDVKTEELSVFRAPAVPFDAGNYETRQVFFASKDGTRVPMFLTMRKGMELNGDNPVLLYGYGGFNINLTPYFSTSRLVFLEAGGIYALVNLRGGAEYGEEWHQAGMLGNKQNVFDDFIGAAEHLIASGYTRPQRIGILGGSNGGLLVSACMLQRPDLFGAVVAAVPVTDMLRYHKFTVGRYWVPEYGNAEENPNHFAFLYKYSPLHNVVEGKDYPPTLVTTADTDDRVVPGHSRKFVATLQALAGKKNPYFIRVETKAGHGAGKPTSKRIEEAADMYAFLFHFLGMTGDQPTNQ